jgi:DNA-binding transcriptional regulator YhcF (GntR family)
MNKIKLPIPYHFEDLHFPNQIRHVHKYEDLHDFCQRADHLPSINRLMAETGYSQYLVKNFLRGIRGYQPSCQRPWSTNPNYPARPVGQELVGVEARLQSIYDQELADKGKPPSRNKLALLSGVSHRTASKFLWGRHLGITQNTASLNRHIVAVAKIEKLYKAYLDLHGVAPSRNKLAKLSSSSVNTVRKVLKSLEQAKSLR